MAADTKRNDCSSVFLIFMVVFMRSSYAYQFYVGGRAGWVVNPPEDYNHWAGRMRFQVNDTLFFKYEKGSNSVFEVNRDDYNQCNTNNPILKLEDGNSIFKFDRSGPFYFISGNKTFCDQGQKISTVVLAIRAPPPPPVIPTPPGQSPAPVPASSSPSHSPAPTPASSPAPASSFPPSISPSPVATPPGGSNASTPGTSPSSSPPLPPSGESPPSPPGSSGSSPPTSTPNGNGNRPANNNSSSARPAFTTSTVLMSAVSLVFVATLGAPIF